MQFQSIIDSSPHGVFIKDLFGRFIQINQAFASILRVGKDQIIGHTCEELLPRDLAEAIRAKDLQALVTPTGIDVEVSLNYKDGQHVYIVHKFPMRDELGNIATIFGFVTDITDRKRAEEALKLSEEKFRQIAENISEVFWITDSTKEQMLYISPAYEVIWGRSCASLLQSPRSWIDAIHPGDRQRIATSASSKQTQNEYNETYRIIRPDGSVRWIQDRAFPLRDLDGKVFRLVGIAADITELKEIQNELSRQEQQYRGVFTAVSEGLIIRDWDETIVEVNPAFCQMLGYTRDECFRLKVEDFIAKDSLPFYRLYVETVHRGHPFRYEGNFLRKDGTPIAVEASGTILHYDSRPHMLGVIRDVSERRRAEEALRRSEADFRITFENAPIGIALVAEDGKPIRCNRAVEAMLGYSAGELQNMIFTEFTYREDIEKDMALYRELMAGKRERYQIEKRFLCKNGKIASARLTVSAVRGTAAERKYSIAMVEDITEIKSLEEQFLRAQRMEAIGVLASGIAHDLNNILAPMLMAAALLKERLNEERDKSMVSLIENGAQRGADVVRQLLTFSRGLESARVNVQARHLINDMAHIVAETFPRNIVLERHGPPDLWTIKADPTQLHQVLMNLCVNARDAMPNGGKLSLKAENLRLTEDQAHFHALARPGAYVVLTVADTGVGIPPDIINRIFEPFFTTKPIGKGTGLGLSTVLGIIKSHGGFVTVSSESGQGTIFRVYLPAADAPDLVPGKAETTAPSGRNELILVVDDEASIREAVRELLQLNGYRVVSAADGEQGLQLFLENRDSIQLVLTDLMMPVMGGADLIRSIRILEPKIKYIVSSGLDDTNARDELAALGVAEFLIKPYESKALLLALHRALVPN